MEQIRAAGDPRLAQRQEHGFLGIGRLGLWSADEPALADVITAARSAGARVREVARGDGVFRNRRSILTALGPPEDWAAGAPSENDRSIVLLASVSGARLLLTGDIERPAERRLLSDGCELRAQVLKVPHHGAATSSTRPFLDAVRPGLAVCSVGLRNRHGHPDRAVIDRLRAGGASVLRTDRDGAVLVSIRGDAVRARAVGSSRTATVPLRGGALPAGTVRRAKGVTARVYGRPASPHGPTRMVAE